MRVNNGFRIGWMSLMGWTVVTALSGSCVLLEAQTINAGSAGNNATYSGTSTISGSTAYVDAFGIDMTTTDDFCLKVNKALVSLATLSPTGGVIDARGLNSSNTTMTCAANTTPWLQSPTSFATAPADILLPVGAICIQTKWILPDRTRVFGAGPWASITTEGTYGTYIYAVNPAHRPAACSSGSAFTPGSNNDEIVDLGYNGLPSGYPSDPCPNGPCTGVAVDGITLDGLGLDIGGIVNHYSAGLSYVNQVTLTELPGAGTVPAALTINYGGTAPFTNLQIGSGSATDTSSTECVELQQSSGVGGIHGMTCTGEPSPDTPNAGVFLNASSNSIEDVHFEGIGDGIAVVTDGNFLLNVEAASSSVGPGLFSAYLCGSLSTAPCPGGTTATDTVVLGIEGGGSAKYGFTNTLQDDVTGATLNNSSDASLAMYVLGEPVPSSGSTGYSRYNTSPRYPTWEVGNGVPTDSCGSGASPVSSPGSVYSNTGATYTGASNTIWVCVGSTWVALK